MNGKMAYALALAAALLGSVLAGAGSAPTTTAKAVKVAEAPGEFGLMLEMFQLEGPAKARFMEKVRSAEEARRRWDSSDKGRQMSALGTRIRQLPAADPQRPALQAQFQPLEDEYRALRARIRAEIILTLNDDQQQRWISYCLYRRIRGAFKHAGLSPEQVTKVQAHCLEHAGVWLKEQPTVFQQDPYLRGVEKRRDALIEHIRQDVLTEEQRDKLRPPGSRPVETRTADSDSAP